MRLPVGDGSVELKIGLKVGASAVTVNVTLDEPLSLSRAVIVTV